MLWEGWWLETMSYPSSLWSWSQSASLLTADNFHKILVVLVGRSNRGEKKKKGQVMQTKTYNTHRPSHFACLPGDQGAFLDWRSALTGRMSAENRRDAVLPFTWLLQRTVVPRLWLRISLTLGDFFFKPLNCIHFIHLFLAMPCGMWDLSPPTRDWTWAPCSGSSDS